MSEKLKLKSIREILDKSFYIPAYQRGYRWSSRQVIDLLDDIWEFALKKKKEEGEFYCLQPVVVKKDNEKFRVIDGQQRLTTLFIILKFFEQHIKYSFTGVKRFYTLEYETRNKQNIDSNNFLENIRDIENFKDNNSNIIPNIETIDFYYMSNTYITIKQWFDKQDKDINPFLQVLLNSDVEIKNKEKIDVANNVRVIWYEIYDENEINVFTRLNIGKIPLTNAELIKALLIQGYCNKDCEKDGNNNKQFELASDWDFIEYSLQNDDFWYFINKEKNEKATRIEFIFELIAEQYIKDKEDLKKSLNKSIDRYYEFHIINHYLKEKNQTPEIYKNLWSEVKNYFRILNEWYEDREFFHKIGFLIIYSEKTMLDFIAEYIKKDSTKKEFIDFLDREIKKLFENIDIEALSYGSNDNDIRKVLLWFNISTIIQNEESNLRFQFDRYKKQKWDIEHIRSQADKYPRKKEEKEAWLKDILNLPAFEKTEDDILEMNEDFKKFFDDIQNKIEGEDNDFNKHSIGNLTLLDSATNRAYGNAFFPVKRKTIIENDMNGTFIPICTKNLFLKYYSLTATDLQKWTKKDAEDYKNTILETFKEILKNGAENEKQ
ncbi:DUF262 domain-containing protein [Aliarcobacter butzleri]|uniref:DUF262 domain-containing protein n=1 Tax=Aliarcobacter TaxID=2321111 RepID=UPI0021B3566F|nr:DUF262 domain-containing protein [Aliarcobacter butzleri]MCT7633038.1 DUF262 domain-containing protein [Aliarcobacter butzleri]